ncbi:hypothetical protein [Spiroplasma diminutum]|uniref:Uncharacterized protein n=1 Tax=Spiroplasma diminutum CUAS-1 TaxID=1276221 RepID=S5LWT5_9MOLU|nr:hypothetical protein [Spiroplasma diminutum]AGR42229.1 hypothetical protein SDIMI_v3c05250 [Spiroplasma diminutum CUAS-1]
MKTLLTLLGGLTISAQPVALTADMTGIFNYISPRFSETEKVNSEKFDIFTGVELDPNVPEDSNFLEVQRNTNYGIGVSDETKVKGEDIGGDLKEAINQIKGSFKYSDGENTDNDVIYNLSSSVGKGYILKNDNKEGFEIFENDVYSKEVTYNRSTAALTTTYNGKNGFQTSKTNYLVYANDKIDNNENQEGLTITNINPNNEKQKINLKTPAMSKINKVYVPTRSVNDPDIDNHIYLFYSNFDTHYIATYNLNPLVDLNTGELDFSKPEEVEYSTIQIQGIKTQNIYDSTFTMGSDNKVAINFNLTPEEPEVFNSYIIDSKNNTIDKQEVLNFENLRMNFISNTDHTGSSSPQYTILSATDTTSNKIGIYYIDSSNANNEIVLLFELDPQYFTALYDNEKILEENKINGFYSYYDDINKNYNIVVTTANSVYQYSYKDPKNMSQNGIARKILFLDSTFAQRGGALRYSTLENSIMYYDNRIQYILSDENANTFNSFVFEKYDLNNLVTNRFTYNPGSALNGKLEYEEDLKNKLSYSLRGSDGTSTVNSIINDPKVRDIFEGSKLGTDYELEISDDNLIPENIYGKINETGNILIKNINSSNTSRFKNSKIQTVNTIFTNRYNLQELIPWEENYVLDKYDDFNSVVGWVYNQIQEALEKIPGFQNEILWKELEQSRWEINSWYASNGNDEFSTNGWGFAEKNPKLDEDNNFILSGIRIRPNEKNGENDFFYLEDGNDFVTLPTLKVKMNTNGKNWESVNDDVNKIDIISIAQNVSKMQFNGIGLYTNNDQENLLQIQNRLNQHKNLDPAVGLSLIDGVKYSFKENSSTFTVRVFDRAFNFDRTNSTQSNINGEMNYTTIDVTIYGLKTPSSLPRWVPPILVFGGMLILILVIMSGWFISRKRFYKSAVGKEAAKIAQAKRREEKKK